MARASRPVVATAALALVLIVAGCGDETGLADAAVAVRVNASDIPVPQVRAVLRHQPRWLAERPDTATAQVVEVLVDQELAAQAATEQGLDHSADVAQALALARREVLARAYQERIAASAQEPSREEIDRYREAHPLLFSQRRIYLLQEVGGDAAAGRARRFAAAAEDLPAAWLEPLAALERGQSLTLASGAAPHVVTLLDVQAAPLGREAANDAIAAHLNAERQRQLVVPAMRALRDAAQIHYRGAFTKAPNAG